MATMTIETVGIQYNGKVYPYAETCWECERFLPIDGYRNMCSACA